MLSVNEGDTDSSPRNRIESLLALRDLHDRCGHVQEIIIQNFRAKPDTQMAGAPEPDLDDLAWTVAAAGDAGRRIHAQVVGDQRADDDEIV